MASRTGVRSADQLGRHADARSKGTAARVTWFQQSRLAAALSWMAPRRHAVLLASATPCLLVSSGCSFAGSSPLPYLDVRPSMPAAAAASPQCPRDGIGLDADGVDEGSVPAAGTLPSTFQPVLVRYCRLGDSAQTEGGLRYTVTEETSLVDTRLLSSLTLPDQKFDPRDDASCAANYTPPVYLLLIDSKNHAYRPHLPADPCRLPQAEIKSALDSIKPATVTTYTFDHKVE